MNQQEFAAELRKMADRNGINFLNYDKVMNAMSADLANGADFINIIPSFSNKNEYLVITTHSVSALKIGMMGTKVLWSVPVADIQDIAPDIHGFRDYISSDVRLEYVGGTHRFQCGFNQPYYDGHKVEIATENVQVAVHEIELAVRSANAKTAAPTVGAGPRPEAGSSAAPAVGSPDAPPTTAPTALLAWMKEHFDDGDYETVWDHRMHLGYEFVQGEMADNLWFWLNAYPALAALRAGVKWPNPITGEAEWHPLVATSAGYADSVHYSLGPAEQQANGEIAQRFFA